MNKLKLSLSVLFILFIGIQQVAVAEDGKHYRKSIAVASFDSKVENFKGGAGMAEMLANALRESDRFVVLERSALYEVLNEQDFAASDRSASALKTAVTGKTLPTQLIVIGTITEFAENTSDSGSGLRFGGISLRKSKSGTHIGLIVRLIDSTTGEVVDSISVEADAESSSQAADGCVFGVCGGTGGHDSQSYAQATEIVIRNAVSKIVSSSSKIPFLAKIIRVSPGKIFTNAGQRNGAEIGNVFSVYSPGEELIDPDTGESLGSDRTKVGSLELVSIEEKFSRALVKTGDNFEKGYLLYPATASSNWNDPN